MKNSHECTVLWVSLTNVPVKIETENATHKVRQSRACKYGEVWRICKPTISIYGHCIQLPVLDQGRVPHPQDNAQTRRQQSCLLV